MHGYFNAMHSNMQQWLNHNDFTFFDFQIVCESWSKVIFERPLEDFELSTNFEVGLNIELERFKPFDVIARYMSYVTTSINEFYTCPPPGLKGKPIQRMCYLSDYKLKGYDKSKQADIIIAEDLLRYEVIYTELRKIRQTLDVPKLSKISLLDLNDQHIWHKLFCDLLKTYDAIKKIPLIPDGYPMTDVYKIHAYCNKIQADDIKNCIGKTDYNKLRAELKNVYDYYDQLPDNYHQIVRAKLVNKYNSLINY